MFKAVATAMLAIGIGASPMRAHTAENDVTPQQNERARAEQLARDALAAKLKSAAAEIDVVRSERATWPDSSMGCGKPGTAALTVITEGYVVMLEAGGRQHRVHVSGSNAVICDKALRSDARSANVRGLDVMMERARQDLAQRLRVDPSTIRLLGMKPQRWPDNSLGCKKDREEVQAGPVDGFVLSLKHADRIYTYHTDRQSVRACPPIESN